LNVRSGCVVGAGGLSAEAIVGSIMTVTVQVAAVWTGGGGQSAVGGEMLVIGWGIFLIVGMSRGGMTIGGKSIGNPPD
jgi:hypothetical protein